LVAKPCFERVEVMLLPSGFASLLR
jgi:hypothetical protein